MGRCNVYPHCQCHNSDTNAGKLAASSGWLRLHLRQWPAAVPAGARQAGSGGKGGALGGGRGSSDEIMSRAITGEGIVTEHSAMRQNVHNSLKSVARA